MNALRRHRRLHAAALAWFVALVLATAVAPLFHPHGAGQMAAMHAAAGPSTLQQAPRQEASVAPAHGAHHAHHHHHGTDGDRHAPPALGAAAPAAHGPTVPGHVHQAECALCLPATAWLDAPPVWQPARHELPRAAAPYAAALRLPAFSAAPASAQAPPALA